MTTIYLYVGKCCREWVMALGYPPGRCGLCGERPAYLGPADPPTIEMRPAIREDLFPAV